MTTTATVKFQKFYVTNGETKARVWYALDNRADRRACVTIYAKDYTGNLGKVFAGDEYKNETDYRTDYFDKGRAVLFEDHPLYAAARARAEQNLAPRHAPESTEPDPHVNDKTLCRYVG